MKKTFALLFFCCTLFSAEDIGGFWKTVDENRTAQCIIGIYQYQGMYYGRIIGTFDDDGKMRDSIYTPEKRAPGLYGNPYYSGLDIIWDLFDNGSKFIGRIMDPEHGKVYNCELWVEGKNLIVRGKLYFFGRNQTWYRASKKDFPKDFKIPDLNQITPSVQLLPPSV